MILTGLESISREVERTENKKLKANTFMLNKMTIEFLNEIVDGGSCQATQKTYQLLKRK
jgi:hypothetical protein